MNDVTFTRLLRPLLGVTMACGPTWGLLAGDVQQVGCNCQNGGGFGAQHIESAPYDGYEHSGPIISTEIDHSYGSEFGDPEYADSGMPSQAATPPGTLGQTYHLASRPVPATKHPRVGMIDVRASTASFVIVRWTNDSRMEETLKGYQDDQDPSIWHFESKPLLPGLSHIHRVEIYQGGPGSAPTDVRYVRLIMGRIVNLTI
ncbi:MAG: hypothetical protein KDA86_02500 [Planctomycetaceae bacterium]|nr:hypothetical protein [Planctomycetaceae bacterium]MCA9110756.1 hypothetical protein [Planctomycetaceae bacterium]